MRRPRTLLVAVLTLAGAVSACGTEHPGRVGSTPPSSSVSELAGSATPARSARPSVTQHPTAPQSRPQPAGSPPPTASSGTGGPTPAATGTPAPAATGTPEQNAGDAAGILAQMSEAQRVGQLFMVGTPATAPSSTTLSQIRRYHVGNVILTGRSHDGTAAPDHVARLMQAAATQGATGGVPLFVATDQEGGAVQVLSGDHLSEIPSALTQGEWRPRHLEKAAGRWARQLRKCGVNMDLAPVMGTVPGPDAARENAPIGAYGREYGFTPGAVARHGTAFAAGMEDNGVAPTIKHFPGLGRVQGNTDYSGGVVDTTTGRHDPYLRPFKRAIDAGVPFVMMSTAYYRRLDPERPAAFSPFIIGTMLRGDLGFQGVVVSDDLSVAEQVAGWSYGQRAVDFISAGGDLVLAVDPNALPQMYHAVLRRARRNPGFRSKVDQAAGLVLAAKQRQQLLAGPPGSH